MKTETLSIEQLRAEMLRTDTEMMRLTMALLAMDPQDKNRPAAERERDAAVTAWALAGRDLDAAVLQMKNALKEIGNHPQAPSCIDCGDKRIIARKALSYNRQA